MYRSLQISTQNLRQNILLFNLQNVLPLPHQIQNFNADAVTIPLLQYTIVDRLNFLIFPNKFDTHCTIFRMQITKIFQQFRISFSIRSRLFANVFSIFIWINYIEPIYESFYNFELKFNFSFTFIKFIDEIIKTIVRWIIAVQKLIDQRGFGSKFWFALLSNLAFSNY